MEDLKGILKSFFNRPSREISQLIAYGLDGWTTSVNLIAFAGTVVPGLS